MQSYQDYLKTIQSGMVGANGLFGGPSTGANYQAEGMTPQQYFDFMNQQVADPMARDGADGGYRDRGVADAGWIPGAQNTGAKGEFFGALAAALGGQALMGNFGAAAGGATTAPVVGGGGAMGTELGALGAGSTPMTLAEQMASYGAGGGGVTGGLATGTVGGFTGAAGGDLVGNAALKATNTGDWLKDNKTLVQLGGGLLGALAGKDTTTSASKDPWGPAQPYLKDNLAQNAAMQEHYRLNPFSNEQKAAYQGLLDTNANNQANAPIMQANANNFMQSKRGSMPAMQGLLSGTKAAPIDWAKYVIGKA